MQLAELALQTARGTFMAILPVAAGALAYGYIAQGKFDEARAALPESPDLELYAANPMFIISGVRAQIELAIAERDFRLADQLSRNLLGYFESTRNRLILPAVLRMHGQALMGLEDYENARLRLQQANETAVEMNARWSLWQILAAQCALEKECNNAELARSFWEQAIQIIDAFVERAPAHLKDGFKRKAMSKLGASV
jgi:hypothetical protein